MSTQSLAQRVAQALAKTMKCQEIGHVEIGKDYVFRNTENLTDAEIMAGLRLELPDIKFYASSDQVSLTAETQTGDKLKFITTWDSLARENLFVTFYDLN